MRNILNVMDYIPGEDYLSKIIRSTRASHEVKASDRAFELHQAEILSEKLPLFWGSLVATVERDIGLYNKSFPLRKLDFRKNADPSFRVHQSNYPAVLLEVRLGKYTIRADYTFTSHDLGEPQRDSVVLVLGIENSQITIKDETGSKVGAVGDVVRFLLERVLVEEQPL